ncbi:MAG: dockerin type I repeat-containing protein [Patescibacteria group bacterium]
MKNIFSQTHKFFKKNTRQASKPKKFLVLGLMVPFILVSMFLVAVKPTETKAQYVDPSWYSTYLPSIAKETAVEVKKTSISLWEKIKKVASDVAFKNALKVFLGKIAEDTATWIASSGPGQGPLFPDTTTYFKDLGKAAAGDYLDSISRNVFGFSICDPGAAKLDIDIALRINLNPNWCKQSCQKNYEDGKDSLVVQIGDVKSTWRFPLGAIRTAISELNALKAQGSSSIFWCNEYGIDDCLKLYQEALANGEEKLLSDLKLCNNLCSAERRKEACTIDKISQNLQQGVISVNGYSVKGEALQQAFESGKLPEIFKPEGNALGQFLALSAEADQAAVEKERVEKEVHTDTFGIGPVRSLISGGIKTPADITGRAAEDATSPTNAGSAFGVYTGSPVADAIGVFTNTLTKKLIERIFKGGIADPQSKSTVFSGTGLTAKSGVKAAKERFASLAQVNFGSGGAVDILNELSACSTESSGVATTVPTVEALPNNCVIDSSFRQAIEEKLTVQEAIDKGLLPDQKVFGFDANGQEPNFRNGYPYRSLIILRKYRIIPVGWELAALYIRDFERQNVTLSTIVKQFDSPDSPYFRLVDPNWVLKAPEAICSKTGYTDTTVSSQYEDTDGDEMGKKNLDYSKRYCNSDSDQNAGKECACTLKPEDTSNTNVLKCISQSDTLSNTCFKEHENGLSDGVKITEKETCAFITPREQQIQRQETCVDEKTCILENDDGTCKQFGSCVEEKEVWLFNGQTCNQEFASCQTYTDPGGQEVSYLQNTLQKSLCSTENAGCAQYCKAYDFDTGKWSCDSSRANTKRFDNDVQSCDASAEGCTEFIRQATGTNLVRNGGFEQSKIVSPANNAEFSGWLTSNIAQTCGAQSFVSTDVAGGNQAVKLQWLPDCAGSDPMHYIATSIDTGTQLANRTFAVSFSAKSTDLACKPEFQLSAGSNYSTMPDITVTPEWQRFSFNYTWASTVTEESMVLMLRSSNCVYLIDNVQVEEGASLTDYKDYGATNLVHLKKAPSEPGYNLGCTGNPITDPAACKNYIAKCSKDDVGCDLFTPIAGGMSVPAKAGTSCPADKVGCAAFREQSTQGGVLIDHDTRTGMYCQSQLQDPIYKFVSCTDDFQCGGAAGAFTDCQPLVSFIAKSGQTCTAEDVGCEAFTNLDEVAKGGEGKAQFTKLQLCVRPDDPQLANYYSWVGSSESGYQLKQFRFKKSIVDAGPCTNLDVSQNPNAACIDTVATQATCTQPDLATNPDCGEFYDTDGAIYYRLRSRIIEASENCQPFRNNVDSRVYYADSNKSLSCSIEAVGCREYIGDTGGNTKIILNSDFEKGSYAPWAYTVPATSNPSTESINYGGHSLQVNAAANAQAQANINNLIRQDADYKVTFWVKSQAGDAVLKAFLSSAGIDKSFGEVTIKADWNQFSLGPLKFDSSVDGVNDLLSFSSNTGFFIDNVVLTELTDNQYRIKASQTACGGFEGCQAYQNRSGQIQNLSSFAKLCKSEKVGCEALINTKNSTSPFAETISLSNLRGDVDGDGKLTSTDAEYIISYVFKGGPVPFVVESGDVNNDGKIDTGDSVMLMNYLLKKESLPTAAYVADKITLPADSVEYWVNDPEKACQPENKGCRSFGRETFKAADDLTKSQVLQSTESVYLKDQPDNYSQTLCGVDALYCDEFTKSDGGKEYFKNPANRTCSYKESTVGNTGGWVLNGTDLSCPSWAINNIPPAVPYGGYAGTCPSEQSGCGNFLDPLGTGQNSVINGDFNQVEAGQPKRWIKNPANGEFSEDHNGAKAVRSIISSGTPSYKQNIILDANTYYVLSAEVEKDGAETNNPIIELNNCRNAQNDLVKIFSPDYSMIPTEKGASQNVPLDYFADNSYRRISGRFYSGNAVTCDVQFGSNSGTQGHWFADIQITRTSVSSVIQQSVDTTSCNGQLGTKLGCHLFNNLSNTALNYDVDQSPVGSKPSDSDATGSPSACTAQPETCDSNTVLKVTRDRACSKWLSPTSTVDITKPNGSKDNLILTLATCDSFSPGGQCNHFVDEMRCTNNPREICTSNDDCLSGGGTCKPFPMTGNDVAYSREDIRNKSGLVVAGFKWEAIKRCSLKQDKQCNTNADCVGLGECSTITGIRQENGEYPLGAAPQVGNESLPIAEDVFNGNFSKDQDFAKSGWELTPDSQQDGTLAKVIAYETLGSGNNFAPVEVDPYLRVTTSNPGSHETYVRTSTSALANKLTTGKSYYITFKARYTKDLSKDLADTERLLAAGISFNDIISESQSWYMGSKVNTNWQKFTIGPLKLAKDATIAEGNNSASGHNEFNQATGFVYFGEASNKNRTPFEIDEVSILPVLQVNDTNAAGDHKYIARSCRAYPGPTAPSCSYQDDTGKIFEGWRGYCLETDPKNPNTCLSWYPVDLIAGERNIFSSVQASGYNGKSPAYMCLKSNDRYNATETFVSLKDGKTYPKGYRSIYSFNDDLETYQGGSGKLFDPNLGIHKNEIDRVALIMTYTSDFNFDACSLNDFRKAIVYSPAAPLPGYFQGTDSFAYSRQTPDGCAYMVLDSSTEYTGSNIWAASWKEYSGASCDTYGNQITFDVIFDSNGYLQRWASYVSNTTGVGCNDHGTSFKAKIYIYLKEMCTDIVQVVDDKGENKTWATSINSDAYTLPNYVYKKNKDDAPYGSIVPPEVSTPDNWFTALDNSMLEVFEGNPTEARAGTSYSCQGNQTCSGRQCMGITYDKLKDADTSYNCDNIADISKCFEKGGHCGGVGPAKICVSGPLAPKTGIYTGCNSDADCGKQSIGTTSGKCDYGFNQYYCSSNGDDCTKYADPINLGKSDPANTGDTSKCPTGDTCDKVVNKSGGVYATGKTTDKAILRLKLLFADAYYSWSWNQGTGKYEAADITAWKNAYENMLECSAPGMDRSRADSPTSASTPIDGLINSAYCGYQPEIDNITVGNRQSGVVIVRSGENIELKFNTSVDKQQQPLKSIAIDWDGNNSVDPTDLNLPWGYDSKSDPANQHSYNHQYRFGASSGKCYKSGEGEFASNPLVKGHEYCVAKPKIQIQDNWEWCNGGRCIGSFPSTDPVFWKAFGGSIIVIQ